MRSLIPTLALALLASTSSQPAYAQDGEKEALFNAAIDKLVSNDPRGAVDAFLGSSELMARKQQEIGFLATQIAGTFDIYGPVSHCTMIETDQRADLLERRIYLCQHEHFLTRWTLLAAKTTNGWVGANLNFDDKIDQVLD